MKLVKTNVGKIVGEENVLKSPIFAEAFDTICKIYEPQHEIAVFSLCTQTKPFSQSMKWRGIIKMFGGWTDLIVCSSAGIIPLQYENCYPFDTYDSHSGHAGDESLSDLSKNLFEYRCQTFLSRFKWKKVVFLLDPYEGATDVVNRLGMRNVRQFPSPEAWDSITSEDFIGYSLRFCKVLNRKTMQQVERWIGQSIPYMGSWHISRKMSLIEVMHDIWERMDENVGYTKQSLCQMIDEYEGAYDKSYKYKAIAGNVVGARDYKFYIKNNNYFVQIGSLYYKNTGNQIIPKNPRKKLF